MMKAMLNKYAQVSDYDYKMIEAYIDKPEVTEWYVDTFKHFNVNGIDVMRWKWSWWAFFGNVFYFLYRKCYLAATLLFIAFFFSGIFPLIGLIILLILNGGYAPYFVYKNYKEKRLEIEAQIEDEEERIEMMRVVGGYNDWAIWIGVAFHFLTWITTFLMMGFFLALFGLVAGNAVQ